MTCLNKHLKRKNSRKHIAAVVVVNRTRDSVRKRVRVMKQRKREAAA